MLCAVSTLKITTAVIHDAFPGDDGLAVFNSDA